MWLCFVLFSRAFFVWRQREHDKKENMTDGAKQNWASSWSVENLSFLSCVPEFWIDIYCDLWCTYQATYYHDMSAIR